MFMFKMLTHKVNEYNENEKSMLASTNHYGMVFGGKDGHESTPVVYSLPAGQQPFPSLSKHLICDWAKRYQGKAL